MNIGNIYIYIIVILYIYIYPSLGVEHEPIFIPRAIYQALWTSDVEQNSSGLFLEPVLDVLFPLVGENKGVQSMKQHLKVFPLFFFSFRKT